MFAGGERGERLLDVDLVRRGDVDDIDVRRAQHGAVIVVAVDFRNAPLVRGGLGVLGRAADGGDLHAEALEGFDVNRADESGADDTGAKMMKWLHAPFVSTASTRGVKATLWNACIAEFPAVKP